MIELEKAYRTPTREIYDKLMNELTQLGYTWRNGDTPFGFDGWKAYKKDTYVRITEEGLFGKMSEPRICFGDVHRIEEELIDYVESNHKTEDKSELKYTISVYDNFVKLVTADEKYEHTKSYRQGTHVSDVVTELILDCEKMTNNTVEKALLEMFNNLGCDDLFIDKYYYIGMLKTGDTFKEIIRVKKLPLTFRELKRDRHYNISDLMKK